MNTQTKQTKHTPGPLVAIGNPSEWDIDGAVDIRSDNQIVARAFGTMEVSPKAMAAFIVRACNCHEELVKGLQQIADMATGDGLDYCRSLETFDKHELEAQARFIRGCFMTIADKARAAIAKARGEA